MKYMIFVLFITMLSIISINKNRVEFKFMDINHTKIIKSIAIILVVLTHMGGKFGIRYLTPLGGIGVALFLICSGYGLIKSYERKGLQNYWSNKIKNVYIPYVVIQIFIWILDSEKNIVTLIGDLLIIGTNHPYGWYMKFLLFWYLIFYILAKCRLMTKDKIYIMYIISIGILLNSNGLWAEQAFSFTFGLLLAYNYEDTKENSYFVANILLVFGILCLGVKQLDLVRNIHYVIFNFIQLLIKLPIAYSLIIYSYKLKNNINIDFISIIGNLSYYIYLIHGYSIVLIDKVSYISILMFIILTLYASYIFNKILSKNLTYKIEKLKV